MVKLTKARLFYGKREFVSLADTEAEHGDLFHGDVVVFGGDRYENAKVLIVSPKKRYFVDNTDTSGSGYLTIPEEVSKYYTGNILTFYSKIIDQIQEDFFDILISNDSSIIKGIYGNTKSEIKEHAKFSYVLKHDSFKFKMSIKYKGAIIEFPKTVKMEAIEKKFISNDVNYIVKLSISVAETGKGGQGIYIPLENKAIKALFPSTRWSSEIHEEGAIVKGPTNESKDFVSNILNCNVKLTK